MTWRNYRKCPQCGSRNFRKVTCYTRTVTSNETGKYVTTEVLDAMGSFYCFGCKYEETD